MRKPIHVTETIIARAEVANSSHCMIADAIREANPAWTNVVVDLQTIRVTDRQERKRYIFFTPLLLQQQLLRFDQGTRIPPWSFRMPRTPAQVMPLDRSRPGNARQAEARQQGLVKEKRAVGNESQRIPTVEGGKAPPAAVLSNSRGRRRVFGIRAAQGFDPSQPLGSQEGK